MFHCRKHFDEAECQIFFRMIKIVVGIEGCAVDESEVMILYNALQMLLREAIVLKDVYIFVDLVLITQGKIE